MENGVNKLYEWMPNLTIQPLQVIKFYFLIIH